MSMLNKFSPKKTRNPKHEPKKSNLPEVRVGPVQEIQQPDVKVEPVNNLIEQYKFSPESSPEIKKEIATDEHKIISEQKVPQNKKEYEIECPEFQLWDLIPMCEEALLFRLYKPQEQRLRQIDLLKRKHQEDILNLISDYKTEIELNSFRDHLYYFEGEVIITEEYLPLTGFLREYFEIEKVYLFQNTGIIKLVDAEYCNFWFKYRMDSFFERKVKDLSHAEMINDDSCSRCMNTTCAFRVINK